MSIKKKKLECSIWIESVRIVCMYDFMRRSVGAAFPDTVYSPIQTDTREWWNSLWVACGSMFPGSTLSLGYCLCGIWHVLPMSMCSSRFSVFPPLPKNMLFGEVIAPKFECVSMHSKAYSHLTPRVPAVGSGSTTTMTKKTLPNDYKWTNDQIIRHNVQRCSTNPKSQMKRFARFPCRGIEGSFLEAECRGRGMHF